MRSRFWLALLYALGCGACDPKPVPMAVDYAKKAGVKVLEHQDRKANPVPPPAVRRKYVVAALGDSITDSKNGGGGYLKYAKKACPESTFLNFGKGGDMTNQMRKRFERELLPQVASSEIDTLIVFGGVNDLYSDLTAGRKNVVIERDLEAIYAQAHAIGLRIVAITVSPWAGFSKYWTPHRGQNTQLLNSWILGLVAQSKVDIVLDSFPLLACEGGDALCAQYESVYRDGLHPGPKGHLVLGKKLVDLAFADCR